MKDRLFEFQQAAANSPFRTPPTTPPAASPTGSGRPPMAERSASGGDSLGGGDDLEMGVMPPNPLETFLATIEDIRLRLEKINKSVGDIEGLHRQVLNAVSVEEATRLGRLIDELVSRTNAEAQHIRRALKSLASETEEHRLARTITPSDLRMRTTQQTRYAKKFMATMSKFQSMQTTYQAKYRQQLERQYLIVKPSATREELDQLTHSADPTALLNQQIFSIANRSQAQKTLAEMRERHHDILAIEKSIKELHQMFVDMAIIVEQQGELIDKIEDHVSNTVEYTEHAAVEMRQAVERQKSIQKKKWILLTIGLVLLLIIGISLWLSLASGNSKSSTPPPTPKSG